MSLEAALEQMADAISARVPHAENEYIGEDGLLHCSVCHRNVQVEIEFLDKKKIVRCICDCRKKELDEFEDRKRYDEQERRRRICFSQSNMYQWTFKNDDRRNSKLSDAMMRYAENFAEFKKSGKGLLLYGTVGTGKTYYAACIANRLIDNGRRVLMTDFVKLTNQIQGTFEKQQFIDSLNSYELLIIDDLGAERDSAYMKEMVFNIVNSRYISGLPFIITTNLTADEIKKPQDVSYQRIYDRIIERCFPVEISGVSRRRQNVKDTFFDVKEKLGL